MNYVRTLNLPNLITSFLILKPKFNLKVFWILSIIFSITLFALYIFQVNSVVSEGYSLQKHEKRLNELSQENKNLEINFFKVNSLENIELLLGEFNFEKVDKIHYIRIESTIAKQKP